MKQVCQSRLSICQIRNKPLKICQRLANFYKSGEISPNLVTLIKTNGTEIFRHIYFWQVNYGRKACFIGRVFF